MDRYLAEFCNESFIANDKYKNILLYIFVFQRKNQIFFNKKTLNYLENHKDICSIDTNRNLARYKSIYDRENATQNVTTINDNFYIAKCQVANFRGFGKINPQDKGVHFELSKRNNIIFAPNGGGKTSFCELLEYLTTGKIKEAERRKTTLNSYIRRVNAGKPEIKITSSNGKDIEKNDNNIFNFIDRNRLQAFSLLGSKDTTIRERDIIAALVGLEDFDFMISKLVNPSSFNLNSIKKNKFNTLSYDLTNSFESERSRHEFNKKRMVSIESLISNKLGGCTNTYSKNRVDIKTKFIRLTKLLDLKNIAQSKINQGAILPEINIDILSKAIFQLRRSIKNNKIRNRKIEEHTQSIDYYKFYQASKNILEIHKTNACPLCQTEYENTKENPHDFITNELEKFKLIAKLNTNKKKTSRLINKQADSFKSELQKMTNVKEFKSILSSDELEVYSSYFSDEEQLEFVLSVLSESMKNAKEDIDNYNKITINNNDKIRNSALELKRLKIETSSLEKNISDIRALISQAANLNKENRVLSVTIKKLREDIKKTVPLLEQEIRHNKEVDAIVNSYSEFRGNAYKFKERKEEEILDNLEGDVLSYYNKINSHDSICDSAIKIEFIKQDNYRILITYANSVKHDAFISLSEGHLRALGLSILLALAKKKNANFIVFDDVVNAIDTEHRANIVELFLTDPFISKTQQIITTHDRLFWERYSLKVTKYGNGEYKSFVLDSSLTGIHITPKNIDFESTIKNSLACFDIRQALIYSRVWFETMVSEYCTDNQVQVTGCFSPHQLQKPNFIKLSIESMYNAFSEYVSYDTSNIDIIRQDVINWSVQNQEHHAFSESNYNVVHAKTSSEVLNIFKALKKIEAQIKPNDKLQSIEQRIQELDLIIIRESARVQNINPNVPSHVSDMWNKNLSDAQIELVEIGELKEYCEFCIAKINENNQLGNAS